jgi:hypothetical protein
MCKNEDKRQGGTRSLQLRPPLTARFRVTLRAGGPVAGGRSAEVDELIERLRSVGITPLEVRISPDGYKFRIEGETAFRTTI